MQWPILEIISINVSVINLMGALSEGSRLYEYILESTLQGPDVIEISSNAMSPW